MKTATSLTLIAIGAIFAFAITSHPSWLNLQVAGLVVMATGVAGLLLPRRGRGWLRRRVVVRKGSDGPVVGHVDEERYPSYVMLNPAALDSVQPDPVTAAAEEDPATIPEPGGEEPAEWEIRHDDSRSAGLVEHNGVPTGGSEMVTEVFEE
jgi:hypothetical protein